MVVELGTGTGEIDVAFGAAVRYLYEDLTPGRQANTTPRTSLARSRALFAALGDPQNAVPAVHVAGTAGKGSVCAFTAAILTAHGFRVGAHLSPHAYSILERFQLDSLPVARDLLVEELDRVRPAIDAVQRAGFGRPTFFEVTNAIAFDIFATRVDYSVIETGLGGQWDSTNTIERRDKLAVITSIGLDHTDVLGETLAEIAGQKAGILPYGGTALSARNDNAADAVIEAVATRRGCSVEFVRATSRPRSRVPDRSETVLRRLGWPDTPLGMPGAHQAANAMLAVRAVETLAERDGWSLDYQAVRTGLVAARLPGRFERRRFDRHTVVLDGAHNPMKLAALVNTLHDLYPDRRFCWVVALKQNKDLAAALRVIVPAAELVVATEFDVEGGDFPASASVPAGKIAAVAAAAGVRARAEPDVSAALDCALACSTDAEQPVIVTGSFHLLAALAAATRSWSDPLRRNVAGDGTGPRPQHKERLQI